MNKLRLIDVIQDLKASEWQIWDSCHLPSLPSSPSLIYCPPSDWAIWSLLKVPGISLPLCLCGSLGPCWGSPAPPFPPHLAHCIPIHHLRPAGQLLHLGKPPKPQALQVKLKTEILLPFSECATTILISMFYEYGLPSTWNILYSHVHTHVHAQTCISMYTYTHAYQHLFPLILLILQIS